MLKMTTGLVSCLIALALVGCANENVNNNPSSEVLTFEGTYTCRTSGGYLYAVPDGTDLLVSGDFDLATMECGYLFGNGRFSCRADTGCLDYGNYVPGVQTHSSGDKYEEFRSAHQALELDPGDPFQDCEGPCGPASSTDCAEEGEGVTLDGEDFVDRFMCAMIITDGVCAMSPIALRCEEGTQCERTGPYPAYGICELIPQCDEDSECDNGEFCDGAETCVDRFCVDGEAPSIEDGIGCTVGACDEDNDTIIHTPNDVLCDDQIFCNGTEACNPSDQDADDQGCIRAPRDCDDNNDCTEETCTEELGCVNDAPARDSVACDDGLNCTEDDTCFGGICSGGQVDCSGEACESGTCDEQEGCVFNDIPDEELCSDESGGRCFDSACEIDLCEQGALSVCRQVDDGNLYHFSCLLADDQAQHGFFIGAENCGPINGARCRVEGCQTHASCQDDTECGLEEICNNGTCARVDADCFDDGDCPQGQVCSGGQCAAECVGNEDCQNGQVCSDGACVACRVDLECSQGEICEQGACQDPVCVDDGDCLQGQQCDTGRCVAECVDDGDCAQGEECLGGVCVNTQNSCADHTDCPLGQSCENDSCVDGCVDNTRCADNESCVARQCLLSESSCQRMSFDGDPSGSPDEFFALAFNARGDRLADPDTSGDGPYAVAQGSCSVAVFGVDIDTCRCFLENNVNVECAELPDSPGVVGCVHNRTQPQP
jgi:hypothetical protein